MLKEGVGDLKYRIGNRWFVKILWKCHDALRLSVNLVNISERNYSFRNSLDTCISWYLCYFMKYIMADCKHWRKVELISKL